MGFIKMNRGILWFVLIMFTTMTLYYSNGGDVDPKNLLNNLTSIESGLQNVTEERMPYTSFYTEEVTMKGVIFNIAHGMIYNLFVIMNTMIPVSVYVASGSYAAMIMKLILVYVIFMSLFLILSLLKGSIAIWFFVREKRKNKERWLD